MGPTYGSEIAGCSRRRTAGWWQRQENLSSKTPAPSLGRTRPRRFRPRVYIGAIKLHTVSRKNGWSYTPVPPIHLHCLDRTIYILVWLADRLARRFLWGLRLEPQEGSRRTWNMLAVLVWPTPNASTVYVTVHYILLHDTAHVIFSESVRFSAPQLDVDNCPRVLAKWEGHLWRVTVKPYSHVTVLFDIVFL